MWIHTHATCIYIHVQCFAPTDDELNTKVASLISLLLYIYICIYTFNVSHLV